MIKSNNMHNMHKPESIQENKTHQILWDFEVQTEFRLEE